MENNNDKINLTVYRRKESSSRRELMPLMLLGLEIWLLENMLLSARFILLELTQLLFVLLVLVFMLIF